MNQYLIDVWNKVKQYVVDFWRRWTGSPDPDPPTAPAVANKVVQFSDGVVVEQCPTNLDYRYYGFRVPIPGHFIWHAGEAASQAIGDNDNLTLALLAKIPGLQGILLWEGYQVNLTKAAAYSWDEVEPAILAVLHAHNQAD